MLLSNLAGGDAHVEETLLEQRILEDDLSLQLQLLQQEMPEPKHSVLFPIEEELTMHPEHFDKVPSPVQALPLVDVSMFDAVAICAVLGIIILAPHLIE
jgi:hypothetical protein